MDDDSSTITAALATLVAVLMVYKLWKKQHTQCNFPPGPFSLPLIGNVPQIALAGSFQSFIDNCRHTYGDVR